MGSAPTRHRDDVSTHEAPDVPFSHL